MKTLVLDDKWLANLGTAIRREGGIIWHIRKDLLNRLPGRHETWGY